MQDAITTFHTESEWTDDVVRFARNLGINTIYREENDLTMCTSEEDRTKIERFISRFNREEDI